MTGATTALRPGAANNVFIRYGSESATNATLGKVATLTGHVFDCGGQAAVAVQNFTSIPDAVLALVNCTYKNAPSAPSIVGFASVTGAITAA